MISKLLRILIGIPMGIFELIKSIWVDERETKPSRMETFRAVITVWIIWLIFQGFRFVQENSWIDSYDMNEEQKRDVCSWYPKGPDDKMPEQVTARVLHYVWGLSEKNRELSYLQYVAVLAAKKNLQADYVYFHYAYPPKGKYFDKLRGVVKTHELQYFERIYGIQIYEDIVKSEYYRMAMIYKYGGIFLDLDVAPLRPFDPFFHNPAVFSLLDSRMDRVNNKILTGRIVSTIYIRWMEAFEGYNPNRQKYYTQILPYETAEAFRYEVCLLPPHAFNYIPPEFRKTLHEPLQAGEEKAALHMHRYNGTDYPLLYPGQYAITLDPEHTTEELIQKTDTRYTRILKSILKEEKAILAGKYERQKDNHD